MENEKDLISLDPLSFEKIEDYLDHVKVEKFFQRKVAMS